ncbi:hypothetical protein GCM10011515_19700 [Tsuneonella deserti]|uniref:CENP-V/GFA domain-containing protein n=1 Tax=Tsuneonella deserti TaxID=2035528 RepID=A0ABQ1SCA0_9SPHN|nr:GFA family protein [Tsuneonella deserti]GGD99965.1 hypothetical protein GCM10011515_19700 [Tsuneonella deserti]
MSRVAKCQCGALTAVCEGEPEYVSACHCLDCQRRSGAPFAAQARFRADRVVFHGDSRVWSRKGDEGGVADMHFCPGCGSTVWYMARSKPDLVAIPVGTMGDPAMPPPAYSVYEGRKYPWVCIIGDDIERYD